MHLDTKREWLARKRVIGEKRYSFHQFLLSYTISSFSIYKKREAIAMAGKTRPTNGTKIDGKYAAAILKTPFFFCSFIIAHQRRESCVQYILSVKCRKNLTRPFFSFWNLNSWMILGKEGFEPSTPRFGSACSDPLSYRPSKEKVVLSGSRGLDVRNRSRSNDAITRDVDHSFLAN